MSIAFALGITPHIVLAQSTNNTTTSADAPAKQLGIITVTAERPSSLPSYLPTTIEGVSAKQLESTINATDSEDALKYLPSLLVRKRYIGDYDHAVLGSRASGTGNSARSLVFADGILLSNLLGNGANFTPRWGVVTPEEIERVDVLYGPFSAAYSGNSVGAVVDYVTKMPTQFQAHAKVSVFSQQFDLFGTHERYNGAQASASIGDRAGPWAWWINVSRLDNAGHPITFGTKLLSAGGNAANARPVTGAVAGQSQLGKDWWFTGATGQTDTVQDHAKAKLSLDLGSIARASYTLGWWKNDATRNAQPYLHDANGQPFYAGVARIDSKTYTIAPTEISISRADLEHFIHGLSVKSKAGGAFDWTLAASLYDYHRDIVRAPTIALPEAELGGAGRITDQHGTGWTTLSARGVWQASTAHTLEFGAQRDDYKLRTTVSNADDWLRGDPTTRFSGFRGNTQLESLYAQDIWRIRDDIKTVLGLRAERWHARDGVLSNATSSLPFAPRTETALSPKAAIGYAFSPEWTLKLSTGRATRFPTVSELYQGTIATNAVVNNDPNLKPEQSWTTELSAERAFASGTLRFTVFDERTRDALYSQTNVLVTPNVTNIQNVGRIETQGLEIAGQWNDVVIRGLDISASATFTDSEIVRNDKFPASVGKRQPRVPRVRANLLLSYAVTPQAQVSLGVRYSGEQFGALDNSDINSRTYFGFSPFVVADLRVRYAWSKQWSVAAGVDNLNNQKYWAFHPYPQRSFIGEIKYAY